MKSSKYPKKRKNYTNTPILICIIVVISIFIMSSCSLTNELTKSNTSPVQDVKEQELATSQPVDHNVI